MGGAVMHRFAILLIACALAGHAAEDKNPLRALHTACAKANDVWTCLQLEAYAKANEQKLRPLLGDTAVYGEILYAFPQPIQQHWESPDFIGVTTWERFYLLAPDGRPLAPSVALPPSTHATSLSFNGQCLATIQRFQIDNNESDLLISARRIRDEQETVSGQLHLNEGEWWTGLTVANDGSATLVGIRTPIKDKGERHHLELIRNGSMRQIEHMHNPTAVGPNGAWFIGESLRPNNQWMLVCGEQQTPIRSWAVGPGVAVVLADKLLWVNADGTTEPMRHPFGIGDQAQLATLGNWLLFGSGYNAKSLQTTDVLGNILTNPGPQPFSTAIYRWEDLIADHGNDAVEIIENVINTVQTETASMFHWQEKQIDVIDLAGRELVRKPFATMPSPVQWMDGRFYRTRVHCQDGTWVIADDQGRELWRGKASGVEIVERNHLFVTSGEKENTKYQLHALDVDAAKRRVVDLALEPGQWWLEMDCWNLQTLAVQPNKWARIDRDTGKVVSMNVAMQAKPGVSGLWDPPGRFRRHNARLVVKSRFGDLSPFQHWSPIDAWRLNRTLVVLNEWGNVSISGKKPGEFLSLGNCNDARGLALGAEQPLVMVDNEGRICGSIVPGPALAGRPADDSKKPREMPPGPWRVSNMEFGPPRGKSLRWDSARAGFTPRRLRSPDNGNLLVITGSVVIEVDPQAASLIGKGL
jgi:hypothetical protein